MTWRKEAACRGLPVEVFFSETASDSEALQTCGRCPVSKECLEHALLYEEYGIWGGTNGTERKRMRIERNVKLRPVGMNEHIPYHPNCGSASGYTWLMKFYRANPDVNPLTCKPCLNAANWYKRELREQARRRN